MATKGELGGGSIQITKDTARRHPTEKKNKNFKKYVEAKMALKVLERRGANEDKKSIVAHPVVSFLAHDSSQGLCLIPILCPVWSLFYSCKNLVGIERE